ncbi:hypothetical protein VCHA47P369_50442 [Vibrio chagasii]|nr:hypothetical protein VCHA36P164_100010 [Vibrio chagasii]CAH6874030.1 hypothetical protein VCHA29O37_260010 [Vibrio chagasii]CAH6874211.1 hypothetical protein VCHA36O163_20010 [Vibrio chagasii]CAH6901672.1 hypothetical protein VCHA31O71_20619 [Vibrio chagasii]CAH6915832.1 hypothetical protein VCHA34P126_20387 [Vibrio chagasii]
MLFGNLLTGQTILKTLEELEPFSYSISLNMFAGLGKSTD